MNNNVVHLMRWLLPFTASFIRNQIVYHQRYTPHLVYAQPRAGAFYDELTGRYDTFYPIQSELERQFYEKLRRFTPRVKKAVKNYILNVNPDIIHVHYGVDCLVYADILRELKIPSCVSFYGYDCASFPKRFYGYGKIWMQQQVFNNPGITAVLAMSEDMKKDLLELGCPEEKIIVHYYGTETSPFYIERSFQEEEKSTTNFLIISSFQERKGHFFLLDAFEQLSKQYGDKVHLHIVGDGFLRKPIEQKVADLKLNNITIYGPVRYGSQEHLDYLKMADVFVHPSVIPADGEKEGIPGAIIEAMAAGLPVVSTYHAGIPYVMENEKTGMLVQEYDVPALKTAMEKMVLNPSLRLSVAKAGQAYATQHLNIDELELELEEIYDRLIAQKQKSAPAKLLKV